MDTGARTVTLDPEDWWLIRRWLQERELINYSTKGGYKMSKDLEIRRLCKWHKNSSVIHPTKGGERAENKGEIGKVRTWARGANFGDNQRSGGLDGCSYFFSYNLNKFLECRMHAEVDEFKSWEQPRLIVIKTAKVMRD
mgnify:FL=1